MGNKHVKGDKPLAAEHTGEEPKVQSAEQQDVGVEKPAEVGVAPRPEATEASTSALVEAAPLPTEPDAPSQPLVDPIERLIMTRDRNYLLSQEGDVGMEEVKRYDVLGLYFSASWCAPCKIFTPQLIEVYNQIKRTNQSKFEIIFISSDRDAAAMEEYFAKMPWLAIPWGDQGGRTPSRIATLYGVQGIPTLILLTRAGELIRKDGKAFLSKSGAKGILAL